MAARGLLSIHYNANPEEKQGATKTESCFSGSVSSARETVSAFDNTGRFLIRIHRGTTVCVFSEMPY